MKLTAILFSLFTLIILAGTAQAETYYFHNDHLGTPQALTDKDQNVVWEANYTPFGEANITKEDVEMNLRLPGQYFDQETGLHYNYFRSYDPNTGRYLQSDPIGLIAGPNTYAYADQNPIINLDLYGLAKDSITARIEALIAKGDVRSLQNLFDSGALNLNQTRLVREGIRSIDLMKRTINSPRRLADILGKKTREVKRAIEQCKQDNLPRNGPIRNPDVRIDPTTGEVFPKLPGGRIGDSIGNIFDFLS